MSRLVPKLRFKEFSGEWEEKTIGEISSTVTDYVANGSFQSLRENVFVTDSEEYALYIRLLDLRAGLYHSEQKFVDKKSFEFLKKSSLHGGELLMANIGANVGEVWQMPYVNKPATLAPNMIMIKFDSNNKSRFTYYFLDSEYGKNNISKAISGSGHPKINKTDLKQVVFTLPPTEKEQQKIADTLSSLDALIEAQNKKKEALKKYKKGLMQQLFPKEGEKLPKLRFKDFSGEWEEKKVDDVFDILAGGDVPKKELSDKKTQEYNIPILSNGIAEKSLYGWTNKAKINKPSLTVSARGTIGWTSLQEKPFFPIVRLIVLTPKTKSNLIYLYYYMKKIENGYKYAKVGIPQLTKPMIKNTELIIPKKLEEQQKIANTLSSLDALIDAQNQKIEALKEHKKGLMQQMFVSGEIE